MFIEENVKNIQAKSLGYHFLIKGVTDIGCKCGLLRKNLRSKKFR